jgi:hypothetical protein
MGTTSLAIFGGLLYPLVNLLSELHRQGWSRAVMRQHWRERLKNSVWIAVAWWAFLFSYHLLYKVPQQIRVQSESTPAPPTLVKSILPPSWDREPPKNPPPSLYEYGHIHVESVNLLPFTDSSHVRANVEYENDGAEDTEFRLRTEILLRPVPNDPIEQKKGENDQFNALSKEIESSRTPLSSLPVHRKQLDTTDFQFPANVVEEYKANKRGLFFMGRFRYFDGGKWNHTDYCVFFKVDMLHAFTCFGHNEEPRLR